MMRRLLLLLPLMALLAGTVWAAPPAQISDLGQFIFDARADMEVLANEVFGEGVRPPTWTFNTDPRSATAISDRWFDNEQLANTLFGDGIRPARWIGITSPDALLVVRNVRHDLELSADSRYGSNNRPATWRGAAPLLRCERTLQNLVTVLRDFYGVRPTTPESVVDYCRTIVNETEDTLIEIALAPAFAGQQIRALNLAMRGDLERLADERLGLNVRPPAWIGNRDIDSLTLVGDNFLDLESLASDQLGQTVRPEGWIGIVSNSPLVSYRNLRHDLELLADATLGIEIRPRGWQGLEPLERCSPLVQDLVYIAQLNFGFVIDETITPENFCAEVAASVNLLAENPPAQDIVEVDDRFVAQSENAFAYMDVGATSYMGIMPFGTRFRAWYRNFSDSSMMFVSGDNFALFVDRRWTTMSQSLYDSLPTLEGVAPLTFCDANWCNGPGPTPTPTGSGPLALLLAENTPPAPAPITEVSADKRQVSWNNIRVTYVSDNTATRTAQVTLEICAEASQVNCEPVLNIFDNSIGAAKPVISQLNGLNVFEFAYGYTANLIIEGPTLFSPDVWISDPTIR